MTRVSYRGYPDPREVSSAFMTVVAISIAVSAVLFVLGSLLGFVTALPIVLYVIVIVRQAKRLRSKALEDLESAAPRLPRKEVEQQLETILKLYGGGPLPSVRTRANRIREQASTLRPPSGS